MLIQEGKNVLDSFREIDEEHYILSKKRVGSSIELFNLLCRIYDTFSSDYTSSGLSADEKYTAPLTLILACQHELVSATLKAMRGHLVDAMQSTRRAIELCAFAKRIYIHPHLAVTWREAGRSNQLYEKYKNKFSNNKLFPKEEPEMMKLYERYDMCSKMMHSSVYSVASRISVEENSEGFEIKFKYYELNEDESEPINTLLYIWDTHALIIRILYQTLTELTQSDVWKIRMNSVDASLMVHNGRWKKIINARNKEI